jgi:hypothetical protein
MQTSNPRESASALLRKLLTIGSFLSAPATNQALRKPPKCPIYTAQLRRLPTPPAMSTAKAVGDHAQSLLNSAIELCRQIGGRATSQAGRVRDITLRQVDEALAPAWFAGSAMPMASDRWAFINSVHLAELREALFAFRTMISVHRWATRDFDAGLWYERLFLDLEARAIHLIDDHHNDLITIDRDAVRNLQAGQQLLLWVKSNGCGTWSLNAEDRFAKDLTAELVSAHIRPARLVVEISRERGVRTLKTEEVQAYMRHSRLAHAA